MGDMEPQTYREWRTFNVTVGADEYEAVKTYTEHFRMSQEGIERVRAMLVEAGIAESEGFETPEEAAQREYTDHYKQDDMAGQF